MTSPTDNPFALLRRAAAVRAAGLSEPSDVASWLTSALSQIAAGADPAVVLGVKARPGRRRPTTTARYRQRDRALAQAFALATGSTLDRGETVLAWWGEYQAGRLDRPDVVAVLQDVDNAGIDPPSDGQSVARIAARAAELAP